MGTGSVECTSCQDGMITCTECSGNKYSKCAKCNGEGTISSENVCKACKDSKRPGQNYDSGRALQDLLNNNFSKDDDAYWSECKACNGTQKEQITCQDCNGSGFGDTCTLCNGSGTIKCDKCNGTLSVDCPACSEK